MQGKRRETLKVMTAALAAAALMPVSRAVLAQQKRSLHLELVGYTLGIHVPQLMAVRQLMLEAGYAEPKLDRIESMQVIAQSIIGGSAELGDADVVSALRATEAKAPLTLVGLVYNNTDQVLIANADKIKSYEDFKNPDNGIALNDLGDFIYVLVSDALSRNGVNIDDATVIQMGGSGSRKNALLAGRIAAVPIHYDQAASVMEKGNYKILVEPWKQYKRWFSEVWVANQKWLDDKANQKALVDFNKATISSFRRATKDYAYFAEGYRKYATVPGHADISDAALHPIWEQLATEIGAWPADGGFKREYFKELLPVYQHAKTLKGQLDLNRAVDPRYVDEALQQLG